MKDFSWFETEPKRGDGVTAWLEPRPGTNLTSALLNVCRIEQYSCRAPIAMNHGSNTDVWGAYVPWDRAFYRGARTIGLAVRMEHGNGTWEKSPVADWPNRPPHLPAEADSYYYYTLPPEPRGLPAPGPLVAFALAGLVLRRRHA